MMHLCNEYIIGDCEEKLDLIDDASVKLIYIDVPYNTKNKNFEYHDSRDEWYSFMETKIIKAKTKLKDNGFIFISIDDNEFVNLRLICDSVFGQANCLGNFITRQATRSNSKHINTIHEYVVVYAKNVKKASPFKVKRIDMPVVGSVVTQLNNEISNIFRKSGKAEAELRLKEIIKEYKHREEFSWLRNYNLVDDSGNICFAKDLSTPGTPNELYIPEINMKLDALSSRGWSSPNKIIKLYNEDKLIFKGNRPYEKHLLLDSSDNAMSILNFYSRQGKHDLDKIGMKDFFSTPKPVGMIKYFIQLCCEDNDVVLDFFAGSGTTAQAVLEHNAETSSNVYFKLIQINEEITDKKLIKSLEKHEMEANIANIPLVRFNLLKEKGYNFDVIIR